NTPKVFRNDTSFRQYERETISQLTSYFELKFGGKIRFNLFNPDLGPLSKIIPTIEALRCMKDDLDCNLNIIHPKELETLRNPDEDTLIVSLDDDQLYSELGIRTLIQSKRAEKLTAQKYALKNPNSDENPRRKKAPVVSLGGNSVNFWMKNDRETKIPFPDGIPTTEPKMRHVQIGDWHSYVDLVEGWAGVVYSLDDIDAEASELMKGLATKISKDCYLSDDLVISFVLGLKSTPKLRIHKHSLKKNLDLDLAIASLKEQLVKPETFKPIEEQWKSLKKTSAKEGSFGIITEERAVSFLKKYQEASKKLGKLQFTQLGVLETFFFEELSPSSESAMISLAMFLDSFTATELDPLLKKELLSLGTQQILLKKEAEATEQALKRAEAAGRQSEAETLGAKHREFMKTLYATARTITKVAGHADSLMQGTKVQTFFSEELKPNSLTEADGLQYGGGFTEEEKLKRIHSGDHGRVEKTKYQFCLEGLSTFTDNGAGDFLAPQAILEKLKPLPPYPWLKKTPAPTLQSLRPSRTVVPDKLN
ncbi:MAG: hypothetical protein HYX41_01480, partial [Bdellovibrio sp.]|nr:hypothetical protein [Bdellovibrio sp.]